MAIPSGPASAWTDAERVMFDFVDAYDRAYETAAGQLGLSKAQACVLGRLTSRTAMGDLTAELGCDASNVTQIVTRLEAKGLVQREQHPHDRRSRQIVRTPKGSQVYTRFERSFEFPRAAIAHLTSREQKHLSTLLHKAIGGGITGPGAFDA